ncbi:MAG: type IV pilus twitching motility protein PilT [Rhodocyclaceae bacterium]|nr:type IV pilus twitching motility protein PilT [Rhodocyclaceae bacterium]
MLESLLRAAQALQASDIHLSAGVAPLVRVNGSLQPLEPAALGNAPIRAMIDGVLPESQRRQFADGAACDFAFSVEGLGRYRANAYRQQRGVGMALRPIPETVPSLELIHAPAILKQLAAHAHGLVLIVGPTGSGKTTTLAAMVDYVNHKAAKHVLTIEDPVEFVYAPDKALITQREVGRDTPSFADALKAALREDPDVILLGEMRDLETIRLALTAAETGHLVLATLHTATAAQAVERIVDVFPGSERDLARTLLADVLRAVVAQELLPRKDGQGRVAAHEVLVGTPAVRNLIREQKGAQLLSAMQTGQQFGMQTMAQSLEHLVRAGQINPS